MIIRHYSISELANFIAADQWTAIPAENSFSCVRIKRQRSLLGEKRSAPGPVLSYVLILNFLISSRPLTTEPKRSGLPSVTTVLPLSSSVFSPTVPFRLFGLPKEEGQSGRGGWKVWERAQLSSRSLRGSIHFSGNVAGRPHLSFKSRAGGGLRDTRVALSEGRGKSSLPIYVYRTEIYIHGNYYHSTTSKF